MTVFEECSVVVDLKNVHIKEKRRLTSAIIDNGGNISYVVNQKCSFVVASSLESLSCSKQRNVQKHQIPVVGLQYVWTCLEQGTLLPVNEHVLQPQACDFRPEPSPRPGMKVSVQPELLDRKQGTDLGKLGLHDEGKHDTPKFPSHFQVAKYTIFVKAESQSWSVLELQSAKGEEGQQYRIMRSIMQEETGRQDKQVRSSGSEEALEVYERFSAELQAQGFTQTDTVSTEADSLASHSLQQLLLEERLSCSVVSQDVAVFLELIWTEALGSLSSLLTVPVTSISLNDVSRVEGILLQVRKREGEDDVQSLLQEVNTLLPLRMTEPDSKARLVSQRLDLCQLIRDILNVSESTLGNLSPSSLGKYRALRCHIEQVPSESQEFQSVCKLLQDRPVQIQQVLRVSRASELHMFKAELGNIKLLLHSTSPSRFVGILSRGLLLPRIGVEQHGIERTDVGNLGSGIYFSDSLSTSVKYSQPSAADGSRLLLVCEVALGYCKDLLKRDDSLTHAPEGHSSVHAVRRTHNTRSEFEDDEYVVYNTDQVRLKYVVQYFLKEDQMKSFEPHIDTRVECLPSVMISDLLSSDDMEGLEVMKNPLEDITPGLLDSSGSTLPLEAVHVRCKLMDLLCQVIIFQVYTNKSQVPIEAKYVFPLEETAAVCGFEAFINGKHIIGKVKEKEQARKEYKQAIEKGHGAYLMDQEAPDVFTISVGNLPAGASVLIKVTYITELVVRAGTVLFSLPASVAPWQQSAALNQRTQASVEKVAMSELRPEGEFSLNMSIEMPYEITGLECSHLIKTKRTDCKAVVNTLPDQSLGADGFQLSFSLAQIHMPRMWVEKHPEKDSEACMLVFYPDFESGGIRGSGAGDVVIVLDTSESMRGQPMLNARRLALKALCLLDRSLRVNIVSFGTDYKEAFPSPRVLEEVFEPAKKFIMSSTAIGGSTELWRPLRSLNLLPPTRGLRNVLLLSDGHVQNQPQTLQMVRDGASHTRLFTCGLSPAANRHMLRALAQAGGGVYEFFDTKKKHTWAERVTSQVKCMASPGCRSVSVKWQRFNPTAPPPVQAPSQLHALFGNRHTLVYGFVPHCTQATLFGDLSGEEIQTMVSTTELQKTKGTFLHKLTARAVIRDYEDGSLGTSEAEHEGKKAALKSYIINLSKEFSILSQFTSFVAIEERDQEQKESGLTSIPDLILEEDTNVDILPYMGWEEENEESSAELEESSYLDRMGDFVECDLASLSAEFSSYAYGANLSPDIFCDDTETDGVSHHLHVLDLSKHLQPSLSSDAAPSLSPRNLIEGRSPSFRKRMISSHVTNAATLPSVTPAFPLPDVSRPYSGPPSPIRTNVNVSLAPPQDLNSALFSMPAPVQRASQTISIPHRHTFGFGAAHQPRFGAAQWPQLGAADQPVMGAVQRPRFGAAQRCALGDASQPVMGAVQRPVRGAVQRSVRGAVMGAVQRPVRGAVQRLVRGAVQRSVRGAACRSGSASDDTSSEEEYGTALAHSSISALKAMPLPIIQAMPALPRLPQAISFSAMPPPPAPQAISFSAMPPPPAPQAISFSAMPPPPAPQAISFSAMPPPPPPQATPVTPMACLKADAAVPRPVSDVQFLSGLHCAFGLPKSLGGKAISQEEQRDGPAWESPKNLSRESLQGEIPARSLLQRKERSFKICKLEKRRTQTVTINWEELFDLQHQDGYWECTSMLSTFLRLDVDFFSNVFLKEKGICSLGVKAHTAILRLLATLLVLQLMRVRKMPGAEFLHSLLHLTDAPEPRPACWEAVERAVTWARKADRQYPCVSTRLGLGWDWESSTRLLLGLMSPPPYSPLLPVLQRGAGLAVV